MWTVLFDEEFRTEFRAFDAAVRRQIAAYAKLLEQDGPELGRPWADTLKGSKHPNMKELRPTVDKVEWRVAMPSIRSEKRSLRRSTTGASSTGS